MHDSQGTTTTNGEKERPAPPARQPADSRVIDGEQTLFRNLDLPRLWYFNHTMQRSGLFGNQFTDVKALLAEHVAFKQIVHLTLVQLLLLGQSASKEFFVNTPLRAQACQLTADEKHQKHCSTLREEIWCGSGV